MQVDPQKSREAHSQTERLTLTAASSYPQHQDSPACDLRGSQGASCDRGDDAPQPFPVGGVVGTPLRLHRQVPPAILQRIYADDQRFNASWTGAPNAEALIYALGFATLIIGVAAWFS